MTFADEVKPSGESSWAYIGVVSVPQSELRTALNRLQADRDVCNYQHEIGWSDLRGKGRPYEKEQLATRWIKRLVTEHDIWRFSVMGINTERLTLDRFGEGKGQQLTNAYRRFYRANLKLHVSTLHRGHDEVHVVKSYHDQEGRLELDDWFTWHPNAIVGSRESVTFVDPDTCFVNSCHVKELHHPKASHFVQLCDLLIGATRYTFEAIGRNVARDRAVEAFLPLASRLNSSKECGNVNSSYGHVGRATLSFFPSKALNEAEFDDQFARGQSTFFRDRRMLLQEQLSGQHDLFAEGG